MDRSYYEGLTVETLKGICRKDAIPGYSGLKKKDLVDLIMGFKEFGAVKKASSKTEESVKKTSAKPKGAKKTSAKPKEVPKPVAAKVVKPKWLEEELELQGKLPQAKITKRLTDQEKLVETMNKILPGKPTGILYVSTINNAMQNIDMYIESGDRVKAIEEAEQVKDYLDKYSFSTVFENGMKDSIKSVITAFGSPGVKKKVEKPKKKTPFKKGDYKTVDILSVKFSKKGEAIPVGVAPPKRINITLEELRKEVDNDEFIKEYTQSVKDLMKAKVGLYQKRKEEVEKEYQSINRKVQKLRTMGTEDRVIRDMYPGFDGLKGFIIDLEDLIALVKKRSVDVTEENIREGLIEAIDDPDNGLSSIIGREDIKNQLASQIYSFSKGYKTFVGSFNNIAIYGPAGTGKTRLAVVIAFALSKIGILARDTVKIVTRADLVGQYVGQTAPRTRSALIETLEGILFVDEAYQLTACPDTQNKEPFGGESITEIVNFLDKYIGLNIVIVAGYEGVMTRCFMAFNEGLPRRFPYRYILSPYSDAELTDILVTNLRKKLPEKNKIDPETSNFIFSMVSKIRVEIPDAFKNQAGDMLNLSASLNKAISSSFQIKWKNDDLANNVPIILAGFDDFLETKGFLLYA